MFVRIIVAPCFLLFPASRSLAYSLLDIPRLSVSDFLGSHTSVSLIGADLLSNHFDIGKVEILGRTFVSARHDPSYTYSYCTNIVHI